MSYESPAPSSSVAVEETEPYRPNWRQWVAPPQHQFPDTPRSPYAPGVIRSESDKQRDRVAAFLHDNPEFAAAPADVVAQYADRRAGYRSDDELVERTLLADEGVNVDWYEDDDLDAMPNSDDHR